MRAASPLFFVLAACGAHSPASAPELVPEVAPAAQTAPETHDIDVLITDTDGAPLVGARRLSGDPCGHELLRYDGAGWSTTMVVGGYPTLSAGPGGELAGWLACEGPHSEGILLPSEQLIQEGVPELIEAVWWIDARRVSFLGRDGAASVPTQLVFARGEEGWTQVDNECVELRVEGDGATRGGEDVSLLLVDDLDDNDVDEVIIEEPGSCGTHECGATVYVACGRGEPWMRPIGQLDHWSGVSALVETELAWKTLSATDHDGAEHLWVWTGTRYERR